MEQRDNFAWLVELPNEILIEILDNLDKFHLNNLVRANKRLQALSQYLLEHKKKIRFCGDHLRVLVLSLPSSFDDVVVDESVQCRTTYLVTRSALLLFLFFETPIQNLRYSPWKTDDVVVRTNSIRHGRKDRKVSLITASNEKNFRQKLWINAVVADLCVFIVDPKEIDSHSEDIKEMIFGACFMMSARNVIVTIDMRNYPSHTPDGKLAQMFNEARTKMSKILDRSVGLCYKIIPVNIKYGRNVVKSHYEWFSGPTLRQLVLQDQLRTNFDGDAFKNLSEQPLKVQLIDVTKHRGVGGNTTVPYGRVISGTLKAGEEIRVHPQGRTSRVNMEEYDQQQYRDEARPGDVVRFEIQDLLPRDILHRFCYFVKHQSVAATVNCTIAFRASIGVLKPKQFTQLQTYHVLYGPSLIKCILWWILPEDVKNAPKQTLRKAILLPLIHYDIEPYKPSPFEKNYCGKVMMLETGVIVGVGRVDRVINFSADTFQLPTNPDYIHQYGKVVSSASSLFKLPTEQKQLELFLDHVTNDKQAKNSILRLKPLTEARYW
jgi:translation elongation factor EF-1alpha